MNGEGNEVKPLRLGLFILFFAVLGVIFPIFLPVIGAGLLGWGVRTYRVSEGRAARHLSIVAMLVGIGLVLFALLVFFGLMTADVGSVEATGTSGFQGR